MEHFKTRVRAQSVESETPLAFVHRMHQITALERKPLKFAYSRLNSLLRYVHAAHNGERSCAGVLHGKAAKDVGPWLNA